MLHNKANELMEPLELLAGGLAMANRRIDNLDTAYSGSASFNNADGSMTVIGPMAGDFSFATHVGDTTPPPVPAGIECSSVDGTVLVTWDGTLIDEMPPDFYCINIAVNDIVFARLTEAGSANSPKLESGTTAIISVTSEDDACLWDGTPSHNISEPITVEVEVTDVIGEAKAEAKEAIDAAKESAEKVIELEQTTEALTASVSIAQETADNAVTAASTAQQDINGFKTTVEESYLSKSEAETTYTAKSEFEQTTQGLTATVIEAATRADTALTKAARAEITVDGMTVTVGQVQDKVDNLKVGGTNLMPNSEKFPEALTGIGATFNVTLEADADAVSKRHTLILCTQVNEESESVGWSAPIWDEERWGSSIGQKAVFSFWAKANTETSHLISIGRLGSKTVGLTDQWQQFTVDGTILAEGSIAFTCMGNWAQNDQLYMRDAKLELGTIPTTWSPTPSDVQHNIDEAKSLADDANATATGNSQSITESVNNIALAMDANTANILAEMNEKMSLEAVSGGWFRQTVEGGNPVLRMGATGNDLNVALSNAELAFYNGSQKLAYANGNAFAAPNMRVDSSLSMGRYAWIPQANGHLTLKYS